ncbi:hypothetical protein RNZ50_04575 [Paracoccaceae bacterium Fryx2]|nr:hypothetical protein [Paracoccaceae bacterium Fryx2]
MPILSPMFFGDFGEGAMVTWAQPEFNTYMAAVRAANPQYERASKSSIHNLTHCLKPKNFQNNPLFLARIKAAWDAVPAGKKGQYANAWQYANGILFPQGVAMPTPVQPTVRQVNPAPMQRGGPAQNRPPSFPRTSCRRLRREAAWPRCGGSRQAAR